MGEKKSLSHTAYGGVNGNDYIPFVAASEVVPEFTIISVILGCFFAVVFASANTYLALRVGMTIAAGIPAAILGTGFLRFIFRRNNILEANLISGVAAMGESLAGGMVFILPAVFILGMDMSILTIAIISAMGGLLGIVFVVPLRKYLTVEEHGKLAFPESMAAAEVLVTSSQGGSGFQTVLHGILVGGIYKFCSGALLLWVESPEWEITLTQNGKPIYETFFGMDAMASLAGVGFIVGIEAGLYMFAGALVATFGLLPLIKYVGAGLTTPLFPATEVIAKMAPGAIRGSYIRYIGAGAVAAGGFISLAKSLPTIIQSFKTAMSGIGGKGGAEKRTTIDIPMTWVIGGTALVFFLSWLLPMIHVGVVGALLAIIFAFFFAVVSARLCGIIGASNNPISGMTIAVLLFSTSVLKAVGYIGNAGMITSLIVCSIVCISIAVAGGSGQALKTTFIIGGTPKKVQIAMYIGLVVSSFAAAGTMLLLIHTYGLTGDKAIPAPQANLMAMVVKGVMDAQLPWSLVIVGMIFGVMCELMGLPVLPVALGIYLPINLSTGILVGGIVRVLVDKKFKNNEKLGKAQVERGVLLASGLVAGDALVGIIIAVIAALDKAAAVGIGANMLPSITQNHWTAAIIFIILAAWMYMYTIRPNKAEA